MIILRYGEADEECQIWVILARPRFYFINDFYLYFFFLEKDGILVARCLGDVTGSAESSKRSSTGAIWNTSRGSTPGSDRKQQKPVGKL